MFYVISIPQVVVFEYKIACGFDVNISVVFLGFCLLIFGGVVGVGAAAPTCFLRSAAA
jgi:hypothetical protein